MFTSTSRKNKILKGDDDWVNCFVIDKDDFSVKRYTQLNENIELHQKEVIDIPDDSWKWNIPEEYSKMNVKAFIFNKFGEEIKRNTLSDIGIEKRKKRILKELKLWESINGDDLLKTLIYIVDTLNKENIVWGTGRGSSCCSYILYLIGVHDVDSVKYDLNTTDFFRV